jgi:hypothetical protein
LNKNDILACFLSTTPAASRQQPPAASDCQLPATAASASSKKN